MQPPLSQPAKMDETPFKRHFTTSLDLVFVAPISSCEEGARLKPVDPHSVKRIPTFDIVRNCLGTFELMEGRWAGYVQVARG